MRSSSNRERGWTLPVTDISAEAREAAKLAYFSAAAPLADPKAGREVVALPPKSTPLRSTRVRSRPDPFRTNE